MFRNEVSYCKLFGRVELFLLGLTWLFPGIDSDNPKTATYCIGHSPAFLKSPLACHTNGAAQRRVLFL